MEVGVDAVSCDRDSLYFLQPTLKLNRSGVLTFAVQNMATVH